ncbi:MAG: deoxyribodipyrimidine photo-lyase [Candidatus Glassbacteria bacterium]|nr:deoxyribodipyrimidine photo-lyase [Candidatus Glassbacteria bacterium]
MDENRVSRLNKAGPVRGPVVYWMSRDQRIHDNWALLFAQELAIESGEPLIVVFCLVPEFLGAGSRQYGFMLGGLQQVEAALRPYRIPFHLLEGAPETVVPKFVRTLKAGALVADFDPLRIKKLWKDKVKRDLRVPFFEVDAHNVVPCRLASAKQEYSAFTIRKKINRLLDRFLTGFPPLRKQETPAPENRPVDWARAAASLTAGPEPAVAEWIEPGEKAALKALERFIREKLSGYAGTRNDPTAGGQSGFSPYFHFGQLSAQRAALETACSEADSRSKEAFLEELVVRRELADNFCHYNPAYDSFDCFPDWAKKTLDEHRQDPRPYTYSLGEFESASTHDDLWNAAQLEMVRKGKMHGYLRMYWAKKILEWSPDPEEAVRTAVLLNDRYELDGRDPGGYAGIAWSIGGVHDRPWAERLVFGKIRYMSYNGCRRKFSVDEYVSGIQSLD